MDWKIDGWNDLGDAGTAISFVLLLATVIVASLQIRSQLKASRRQAAFETFRHFSEKFSDLATERSALKDDYESGKPTKSRRAVKGFYQRYWALQISEWEMFRARLLPSEIYAAWLCYVHDNICGDDSLYYKSGRGVIEYTNADAFKEVALDQMMRSQPACRDFFLKLSKIDSCSSRKWSEDTEAQIAVRLKRIRQLLANEQKLHKITKVWP